MCPHVQDIMKGIHKLEGINVTGHGHWRHVTVCAHKGTDMGKDILKGICKLEGINIAKLELDMGIDDM